MIFEEFKEDCLTYKCNRYTFISEQCLKDFKIKKCYNKYLVKIEKDEIKKDKLLLKNIEKQDLIKQEILDEFDDKKQKYLSGYIGDLYGFQENKDLRWIQVQENIRIRDVDCVVWHHILNVKQKSYIMENFWEDYSRLNKFQDCAHIESVARRPDLKYDEKNIVLVSRFFHSRLDQYRDLVTGLKISEEIRNYYLNLLKSYIYCKYK